MGSIIRFLLGLGLVLLLQTWAVAQDNLTRFSGVSPNNARTAYFSLGYSYKSSEISPYDPHHLVVEYQHLVGGSWAFSAFLAPRVTGVHIIDVILPEFGVGFRYLSSHFSIGADLTSDMLHDVILQPNLGANIALGWAGRNVLWQAVWGTQVAWPLAGGAASRSQSLGLRVGLRLP